MSNIPSLEDLLKKGVHFGHKESKWHPNMAPYIYTSRNGVHIIDLSKTQNLLKVALEFIEAQAAAGKSIMFIGTKKSIKEIVKKHAAGAAIPYVSERWLGGTITNFTSIYGLTKKLQALEKQEKSTDYEIRYNKKERLGFSVEKERLLKMIGGIREIEKTPDVLFTADLRTEKTAVREAMKKGVKVVAIADTNVDPTGIDYIIPANDDSLKSVELIVKLMTEAVEKGRKQIKVEEKPKEEKPKAGDKKADEKTEEKEEKKEDKKDEK